MKNGLSKFQILLSALIILGSSVMAHEQPLNLKVGRITGGGGQSTERSHSVSGTLSYTHNIMLPNNLSLINNNLIAIISNNNLPKLLTHTIKIIETTEGRRDIIELHTQNFDNSADAFLYLRILGGTQFYEFKNYNRINNRFDFAIPESLITISSIEYYSKIIDNGLSYWLGSHSFPFLFVTQFDNQHSLSPTLEPKMSNGQSYRMISFPFVPDSQLSIIEIFDDDLGLYDRNYWELGRYNPKTEAIDFRLEQLPKIQPGLSYWLKSSSENLQVGAEGHSVISNIKFDNKRYYSLPLDSGWNQLANPFPFTISFSSLRFLYQENIYGHDQNLLEDNCYYFRDNSMYPTDSLKPYGGFFCFIKRSGISALFPLDISDETEAANIINQSENQWRLELVLQSPGNIDRNNYIGVLEDAAATIDIYDFSKPPLPPNSAGLSLLIAGDIEQRARRTDFRPPGQDVYKFNLRFDTGNNRSVELLGMEQLINMTVIFIHDGSEIYLNQTSNKVKLSDKSNSATIVIVKNSERSDYYLPDKISLGQNYPNPFNPSSYIPFELPRESEVTISIFNINGRLVKELLNQRTPAGYHRILWDGQNSSGQAVASGIYFYRLTTNAFSNSKKMLLLK